VIGTDCIGSCKYRELGRDKKQNFDNLL
jgi:hypothetical protein